MAKEPVIKYAFANELMEWSRTGKVPESGNQDVRYYLELQRERLNDRGLTMEYQLTPPKKEDDIILGGVFGRATRQSTKYESYMDYRDYEKRIRFFRNGKKKYSRKTREILYVMNTWLKEGEVSGEEPYCCPDCGAVSTIRELQEECPYCHARFVMSDLFPKVTDFFYIHNYGEGKNALKAEIARWLFAGALIGAVIAFFVNWNADLGTLIRMVISAAVTGVIGGYIFWAFAKIGSLIIAAVGSAVPLVEQQEAKRNINNLLYGFDNTFCYEYFVNQLVSTLKIIIFARDRSNLVVYEGMQQHPELDEIIDASFGGYLRLNEYRVQNGYCMLSIDIYMTDIHDNGRRIYRKKDKFRMKICKNVSNPEELDFSIKKVKCKGCGASFDATKERHCPYCGNAYDMKEDGWVVSYMEQLK